MQLANQIHGLLIEYGVSIPEYLSHVRKALPQLGDETGQRSGTTAKSLFYTWWPPRSMSDFNSTPYISRKRLDLPVVIPRAYIDSSRTTARSSWTPFCDWRT